ncbi:MAG: hypothetical protein ACK5P3_27955, partial [Dolichospermum sp.]
PGRGLTNEWVLKNLRGPRGSKVRLTIFRPSGARLFEYVIVRDRIEIKSVTSPEPMRTVVTASENVDLTIVGTSRLWGIERQTLGRYTDQLAIQCRSSLLITRRYSQITSHLTSLLPAINTQETMP